MADKATAVSFRYGERGSYTQFRGVKGEITVDITTPTVFVHTGNNEEGVPLAREDLKNVSTAAIAAKSIARSDLSNISIEDTVNVVKDKLLLLGYASRDMDDITTAGYDNLDATYARSSLTNVEKLDLVTKLGTDTFAKVDLTNVTTATIADKGIAKTDLTNVTAATIKEKGIASNTLDNVTLTDTIRDEDHLNLQKVSNCVAVTSAEASEAGTYPTAYSVKQALDAIPPMITNITVDANASSQTVGQITMTISKALAQQPTLKNIDGTLITGTWATSGGIDTSWVFTPADATSASKVLTENWIITLV